MWRGPPATSPLQVTRCSCCARPTRTWHGSAHRPLRAALLQLSIFLLDAATLWVLIRAWGVVRRGRGPCSASFMLASLLRTVGFMPGGLGTFEAAAVSALTLSGIPPAVSLSATLLFAG